MRLPTLRRDIVCRQAVELVTDYLEGALFAARHPTFRGAP